MTAGQDEAEREADAAVAAAPAFFMVPLGVEKIPRFYRGKKKSFSMGKTSYCGKMVTVWRPHYQKQ